MTTFHAPVEPTSDAFAGARRVGGVGRRGTAAALLMPLVATGVLMAAYLALRPHGDHGATLDRDAAEAFASPWWVVAHLCGMFALAQLARLALRVDDLAGGVSGAVARWASLAGLVLVLPYYGAETFGLHAIGAAAVDGDLATLELADEVRNHPAAMTLFGLGLLLLAVGAVAAALAWRRWVLGSGGGGGPLELRGPSLEEWSSSCRSSTCRRLGGSPSGRRTWRRRWCGWSPWCGPGSAMTSPRGWCASPRQGRRSSEAWS